MGAAARERALAWGEAAFAAELLRLLQACCSTIIKKGVELLRALQAFCSA